MHIRTKLLLSVTLLAIALLVSLFALAFLSHQIPFTLKRTADVTIREQIVALEMHAQLRDAEAALYRYLIEGEPGYAEQFNHHLSAFEKELDAYQSLANDSLEKSWAAQLRTSYVNAERNGQTLIRLRDAQTRDLQSLEAAQSVAMRLLSGPIAANHADDVVYQKNVTGMENSVRKIALIVMSSLITTREAKMVQLSDATVNLQQQYLQYSTLATGAQERQLAQSLYKALTDIQTISLRIVNERDEQLSLFANFAAILFHMSQEILTQKIQPQSTLKLSLAWQNLSSTINLLMLISLLVAIVVSLPVVTVTTLTLRQINTGIAALLKGADRVAEGKLEEPVKVKGRDELAQLAKTFNSMMNELLRREIRLKARISELEALRNVGLQLTSTLDPGKVLDTIASSALSLVHAFEVHIFLYKEESDDLEFIVRARAQNIDHAAKPTLTSDHIVNTVVRTGEYKVVNKQNIILSRDGYTDPVTIVQAAAGFPLKQEGHVVGILYVKLSDRNTFSGDDLRILGLLADQAAIALVNAHLYQELSDKESRLRLLVLKLSHVQEEERRLLGLDLHDSLMQLLISSNMHLNALETIETDIGELARKEISQAHDRISEAIEESRRIVAELRPAQIEELSLVDGLRQYAAAIAQREGWQLEFSANFSTLGIPSFAETAIFRIIQEALNNARKHAHTHRIRILLQATQSRLVIEVQDWGGGFSADAGLNESAHLGIVGMQERTALLNGSFSIESQPGKGTIVHVSIPMTWFETVEEV